MNADPTRIRPTHAGSATGQRRSRQSLEFQTFWENLPKQGLIPHKRDLNIARAAQLLRFVMLTDVHLDEAPSMPIRLVGTGLTERIQRDIKGHDYLEFLETENRAGAVETVKLMTERPCGLWQITPLHYERGVAQNMEVTAFPLLSDTGPLIFAHIVPHDDFIRPRPAGDRAMLAATASEFAFIDVGAGVPEWLAG
jgi:hypothetical protein